MVTLLITSFFILAFLAIAIYFWQKPAGLTETESLQPPPGRALFIDGTPEGQALALAAAVSETSILADKQRNVLLERAQGGDKSTLLEVRNPGDADLYDKALNLLITGADSGPKLLSLVSYVTRHELRVTGRLPKEWSIPTSARPTEAQPQRCCTLRRFLMRPRFIKRL
jgi:hypothetical protein